MRTGPSVIEMILSLAPMMILLGAFAILVYFRRREAKADDQAVDSLDHQAATLEKMSDTLERIEQRLASSATTSAPARPLDANG